MNFQDRLVELNKRGLIHAPDESDESFFLRCRNAPKTTSHPSSSLAEDIFDIQPDWVWIVYKNKGLRLWEGGCTWIDNDHITLQLNKAYLKKKSYFGYSKEEVIAHELVHVARGSFEEPIFEEILAYQTASSSFRKIFGPLLRSPKETGLFLIALSLCVFATLFSTFQTITYAGMIGLVTGGSLRLLRAQYIFRRTKKKLTELTHADKVLPMMLRLTDREIIRFSKMSKEEILAYAKKMRKIHIRWQQITACYLDIQFS